MLSRREFVLAASMGAMGLPLLGTAAGAQSRSDTLLVAAEMTPNSLDTHTVGANRASYGAAWLIYDRLLKFGVKSLPEGGLSYDYFKLEPQLAESWEISPDNSSVTFNLRRDAVFHDGTPVTAHDVKWSFDRMVKVGGFPQRQMEQASLTDVNQFEVVDDHTFKLTFLRADKLTLPSLAIVVPNIYNSKLCQQHATEADPWALEWTKNNGAGSGPYKVDTFKASEQIALTRFDEWKGGEAPKIARALFRNVGAAGTRRALLERGDVDVVSDLPPRDVADLLKDNKLRVSSTPMANTLKYLAISTIIKPFDDVRVRQAIAFAIPYQSLIDTAVHGRAQPLFGGAAEPQDASWPQKFPYTYDPDRSKALLAEAGLAGGFETSLAFDAQAASADEATALLIQDSLAKLGIQVRIDKLADFAARRNQKAWPLALDLFGAWFDDPDFFFRWLWHSQNTIWNLASYKSPDMDRLLDQARVERDGARYTELVKQFIKLAATDVPYAPLYQPTLDVVTSQAVSGNVYMFHRQLDVRNLRKD
ncbi:ABC transporter substrate-binding protein [Kaistia sp. 32K]|uniref:ABC transporter substrate-binding protein n=1 Tax=Kaistia sp. 32K TaxID=2795690 RepID=UPI0019158D40|nr:ABC transporter substrate-binding protein [Kaistia sp. 32K]BCP54014.1 ABC transporter substrate-binding protein [Kaistia sp. 32K]